MNEIENIDWKQVSEVMTKACNDVVEAFNNFAKVIGEINRKLEEQEKMEAINNQKDLLIIGEQEEYKEEE